MSARLALAGALAGLAFFPLSTFAQTSVVFPPEYERAWGRGSSALLGGNSTRTQLIVANPFAAGTNILGVGFRPTASTVDRASFTADMEIRISSTTATPGALSSTFANNTGSDEIVIVPRQTVTIPAMPANRSTGFFAQVLFPAPFIFATNSAPNLCVDVLIYGRSAGASWSTDRAFASANGRAANAGLGCGTGTISSTSTGGTYIGGSTINVTLANAAPLAPAWLIPSLDQKEFLPGLPLPFSLAPLGAGAGCDLLVDLSAGSFGLGTDAAGAAAFSFTMPPGLGRFGIGWQWLYIGTATPANPIGFYTTASRATWIGPEVSVPNVQYVWDLSNVNNATGNATTDSTPIMEIIRI